jgi:general secretion pathway protein C
MLTTLSPFDQARLSRLAALAVCVAAGVICLWLVVRLAWLLVPQSDEAAVPASADTPSAVAPAQSVAKWHLFGNPQSVMLAQTARAPATMLKLTLRGTLALPEADQGIAMIEDEHGGERAFRVGEDVADGVKLTQVYTDHVVLNHAGATEMLTLPQPEAHALPEANQRSVAGSTGSGSSPKTSSVPPTYVPPPMSHSALDWSQAQKNLRLDPAELAKQVRIEPVFVDGKISGARLSGGGDVAALMNQVGLKPTDLVTAINGTALSGLSNPQQLMDNFKNASSLQVTVMRDGKPATLTLNLH